ncbi:hypothetical protein Pfo_028864 [Paulownia fortunei]|nr:hypothetical protein Pfo_028864 [Paulownia fortunei]
MSFSFCNSLLQGLPHPRWPLLLYAATPASALSQACREAGSVRLPLDIPSENFCFPARLFKRSRIDMLVPPVFAAVIVAGSACVVKAMGLWEAEDEQL